MTNDQNGCPVTANGVKQVLKFSTSARYACAARIKWRSEKGLVEVSKLPEITLPYRRGFGRVVPGEWEWTVNPTAICAAGDCDTIYVNVDWITHEKTGPYTHASHPLIIPVQITGVGGHTSDSVLQIQ